MSETSGSHHHASHPVPSPRPLRKKSCMSLRRVSQRMSTTSTGKAEIRVHHHSHRSSSTTGRLTTTAQSSSCPTTQTCSNSELGIRKVWMSSTYDCVPTSTTQKTSQHPDSGSTSDRYRTTQSQYVRSSAAKRSQSPRASCHHGFRVTIHTQGSRVGEDLQARGRVAPVHENSEVDHHWVTNYVKVNLRLVVSRLTRPHRG